jgi:hypothetical protein
MFEHSLYLVYSFRNVAISPKTPGQTKFTMVYISPRLFWMGVAVMHSLASQGKDSRAVIVRDPDVFLSRCPSSTTRSATLWTFLRIDAFVRNKSYDTMRTSEMLLGFIAPKAFICRSPSSPPFLTTTRFGSPTLPSHLSNSRAQLLTNEDGHTTTNL